MAKLCFGYIFTVVVIHQNIDKIGLYMAAKTHLEKQKTSLSLMQLPMQDVQSITNLSERSAGAATGRPLACAQKRWLACFRFRLLIPMTFSWTKLLLFNHFSVKIASTLLNGP